MNEPVEDSGKSCIECGYNLTGLASEVCPECGWHIDWALTGLNEDERRMGTPAHRARGWRVIDQTALTLLTMLFAPWRFARQVRADESLWPGICIALTSLGITFLPELIPANLSAEEFAILLSVAILIVFQSVVFALLHKEFASPKIPWSQRFRGWMIISLYSTCFVGVWQWVDLPVIQSPWETNFYWPVRSGGSTFQSSAEWGTTVIFYWWWLILAIALWVRNRPRWLAVAGIPLVFLMSWGAAWLAIGIGNLLD